ncbi:MAG: tail fiber domain-containing protein, partial [Patescibacteria group bacterium]
DAASPDSSPFVVTAAGDVGIGTTTPYKKLSVVGDIVGQHILPLGTYTNNLSAYDLGATGARWNALWAGTLNIGTSTWSINNGANGRLSFFNAASGGGTELFTITTAGNLGIGSSSPNVRLAMEGTGQQGATFSSTNGNTFNLASRGAITDRADYRLGTALSATWMFGLGDDDTSGFAGTEAYIGQTTGGSGASMVFTTGGNVGIGTTTPSALLDVYRSSGIGFNVDAGASGVDIAQFRRTIGANTTVGITGGGSDAQIYFTTTNNTFAIGTDDTSFKISDNTALGTNDRFTIDSSGNVGIGDSSPSDLLSIEGASGLDGATPVTLSLNSTSNGTWSSNSVATQIIFNSSDVTNGAGARSAIKSIETGTTGSVFNLAFFTTDTGANGISEKLRILGTGAVGVNDTTPDFRLETAGTTTSGYFGVTNSADGDIFIIDTTGGVGINDSTPTEGKLTVGGTFYVLTNTAVGADPLCWDGSGGSLYGDCSSLSQWKTNVDDFDTGLEDVLALQPVTFDWKRNADGTLSSTTRFTVLDHDTGFIAEQVAEINAGFGRYDKLTGQLRDVNERGILGALVNATKELYTMIEDAVSRLTGVEARITELEKRIVDLEAAAGLEAETHSTGHSDNDEPEIEDESENEEETASSTNTPATSTSDQNNGTTTEETNEAEGEPPETNDDASPEVIVDDTPEVIPEVADEEEPAPVAEPLPEPTPPETAEVPPDG